MDTMSDEIKTGESRIITSFCLEQPGTRTAVLLIIFNGGETLIWVIPNAEPATKTWLPDVYLESDSR